MITRNEEILYWPAVFWGRVSELVWAYDTSSSVVSRRLRDSLYGRDHARKFCLALGFDPCAQDRMVFLVTLSDLRTAIS